MKILLFADSRGQHKPRGAAHEMFPYKIANDRRIDADLYLCPFKWTTTLDFLATFDKITLASYDLVILYTGIVDWSPRPVNNAVHDVYNSQTVANTANLALNTENYNQKIVNNKKLIFDDVFSEASMRAHLSMPFDVMYEDSKTINMYSVGMAKQYLLPRLLAIPNLLFINANKFCRGWDGDYWKKRPDNIFLTQTYAELFSRTIPADRIIDLLAWDEDEVKLYTCDNLHLSEAGNAYIYSAILQHINRKLGRAEITQASETSNSALKTPRRNHKQLTAILTQEELSLCKRTTLVIGARISDSDTTRINNLKFLLNWLNKYYADIFDILIVEQDDRPRLQEHIEPLPPFIRCVFLFNPYEYNRGWGYNVAVKHYCKGSDVIVLMDTDVLTGAGFIESILACHRDYYAVSPYRNIYYTDIQEAAQLQKTFSYAKFNRKEGIKNPVTFTGGIVILRKAVFLAVNGFEQYTGYGCEDRALDVTLINKYGKDKLFLVDEVYIHLFHDSDRKARTTFQAIYSHLTTNYRCQYDPTIGPLEYIHKNCKHTNKWITEALTANREASFGDVHLYKNTNQPLLINGQNMKDPRMNDNTSLLPRLHNALSSNNLDDAWRLLQSGLRRYQDNSALNTIFKSKLAEIERATTKGSQSIRDTALDLSDTLIILGNGPSLKDIMSNPDHLAILRRCHTFGLNAAYRAYERFNFYPTYFGSFDYEVNESHRTAYEDLVLNCDKISKYFFAKNKIFSDEVRGHPRFQKINFIPAPMGVSKQHHMSTSFDDFHDIGSSGTNAVQVGFVLGYKKIILLGCDCKYVEILDGIEVKNEVRYLLTKDLDRNPNYWFDDYQKAGDKFNKPNTDSIQYVAWQKLKELEVRDNFIVSNGSYPSALKLFDKVPFGIYTKHYENIFLVMSCNKNIERINAIKRQYQNNLAANDLLLFVVGGSDHDAINDESVLSLHCGDFYENLPRKVYSAVRYCVRNLRFRRLVKVDDDIFINFNNFYKVVNSDFSFSYYGRKNPPIAGTLLNQKYHFGRVSEKHKYYNKEFPLPKNIQWNSGGMYLLDRTAAKAVSSYENIEWIDSHLYEDVMVYTILEQFGIPPTHHENSQWSFLGWMSPTLDGILSNDLKNICEDFSPESLVSVHCGASKSRNLDNNEIWDVFLALNSLLPQPGIITSETTGAASIDSLLANNRIIIARTYGRPLSFYVNKIIFSNNELVLIRSEAGQIVKKPYHNDKWSNLIADFAGNVTVIIPDFNVSFLPQSTEATELPNYLILQPGLTFLVRARNEADNIEFLLGSLKAILNDQTLNCELVFVDNTSSDGTYDKVIDVVVGQGLQNISLYKYDLEISRSGDEHSKLKERGQMHRSLDTYYNWCLDQANKYNIVKWDADFLAIPENLKSMIAQYNLATSESLDAIWCSGKTLFRHGEDFYINEDTMYNEFRVFSKAQGYRWEYAPRWEICSKEYMSNAKKHVYTPCVFVELKDLDKNEFEFRTQGGAIASDVRDSRDHHIISCIRDSSQELEHAGLKKLSYNPLLFPFTKHADLNQYEATLEELEGMQSYWVNVYSRPQNPLRFTHRGNAVIQGLWVGEQVTNFHRLCIESFLNNGHCYVLYTYGPVKNLPEGVVIKDANKIIPASLIYQYDGSYAGFSDLFRNKLLFTNGGWYVDLDIFCLRPFDIEAEIVFSMDHYHQDTAIAKKGTKEIIDDKYYVATNPCKLPPGHEIARNMYATIFKKLIFERLKAIWLGDKPDAPESWLKGEVASSVVIRTLEKLGADLDFEIFVGHLSQMPTKLSFYKLLDTYNIAIKDVGQKTWGEIGPIMITREVVSRGLEQYATKPEMFQGIVKYFEIEKFIDPGFDYASKLEEANPYSLDLFYTMWRRKDLLGKFDIKEKCLLRYIRSLVAEKVN